MSSPNSHAFGRVCFGGRIGAARRNGAPGTGILKSGYGGCKSHSLLPFQALVTFQVALIEVRSFPAIVWAAGKACGICSFAVGWISTAWFRNVTRSAPR